MNKMRQKHWKTAACLALCAAASTSTAVAEETGYAGPIITPTSLDFGDILVGTTSAAQTVTIETDSDKSAGAKGKSSLSIVSIVFPAGYSRTGGTCPNSGDAPDPCTLDVVFTPPVVGVTAGDVVVTASSFGLPPGVSNLAVTGNGVPAASLPVPSLGFWGLIALLGGVIGSGALLLARRR